MIYCPHFAGGTKSGLDFIERHVDIVLVAEPGESLEEFGEGDSISTCSLDGFDNHSHDVVGHLL